MTVPAWIDRLAADLLDAEHAVRRALRENVTLHKNLPPMRAYRVATKFGGRPGAQTVTMTRAEARALLRAAMPAPVAVAKPLRAPHARMTAALSLFHAQLLLLNDALADPGQAAAAALALRAELDGWIAATRWRQATAKAGTAAKGWSRLSGTKITRQLTAAERNATGTPDAPGIPGLDDIAAPSAEAHDADRARDQRKRARIAAKAPPEPAEIAAIGAANPAIASPAVKSVIVEVRRRRKAG
jgi:hypothetical protein